VSLQDNSYPAHPKGKWWLSGKTPDYRFTLANERTFLAWIRTALALMAAAVGIEQFAPALSSAELRITIALTLLCSAGAMGFMAWRRWRQNEFAMRLEKELPYTSILVGLGTFMVILASLLGVLLWQAQP
jgi:Predicted membrane protein